MSLTPDGRPDTMAFSHPLPPQGDESLEWYSGQLGRGMKAERSDPNYFELTMRHVAVSRLLFLLGEQGWELCGFGMMADMSSHYRTYIFKRPRS